jgi:hypothetical protein
VSVSTQQIQTVLRTYNKQLKLSGFNRRDKHTPPQSESDKVTISQAGKNQNISKQGASPRADKLTNSNLLSSAKDESSQGD